MNPYEERQEAKRERLRAAADRRRQEAEAKHTQGKQMAEAIPFGQPILVGHYSEKRDRAFRSKIHNTFGKAFALSKEAKKLEERAEAVGTGGISSDDPDAISKLETKLSKLQDIHASMVERNKEARTNGQTKPFMSYQLTNSGANIRSIQKRIQQLSASIAAPERPPVEGDGWRMFEDKEENRICFVFPDIPSDEVRTILKSYAFKWSPTRKAWVRKITGDARYAAKYVIQKLTN